MLGLCPLACEAFGFLCYMGYASCVSKHKSLLGVSFMHMVAFIVLLVQALFLCVCFAGWGAGGLVSLYLMC